MKTFMISCLGILIISACSTKASTATKTQGLLASFHAHTAHFTGEDGWFEKNNYDKQVPIDNVNRYFTKLGEVADLQDYTFVKGHNIGQLILLNATKDTIGYVQPMWRNATYFVLSHDPAVAGKFYEQAESPELYDVVQPGKNMTGDELNAKYYGTLGITIFPAADSLAGASFKTIPLAKEALENPYTGPNPFDDLLR